jgi:hypothetical protein
VNNGLLGFPIAGLRRSPLAAQTPDLLGWPVGQPREPLYEAVVAAASDVAVPSSVSANVKGAWTTLKATTERDAFLYYMQIRSAGETGRDALVDLAYGPAGSEIVIAENMLYAFQGTSKEYLTVNVLLPVQIPAGSRLAARCACSTGSTNVRMSGMLGCCPMSGYPRAPLFETLGYVTADSGGTSVDPGGSAGTRGAWTEIGWTTLPWRLMMPMVGNNKNTAMSAADWAFDIGYGMAGSEKVVTTGMMAWASTNEDGIHPKGHGPFPVSIPAGQRMVARSVCSITDATDRLLDLLLVGIG